MQNMAWVVSLVGMAGVLVIFLAVARRASEPADASGAASKVARIRTSLFWVLVLVIVAITALTLGRLPYAAQQGGSAEPLTVTATGEQWRWTLSHGGAVVGQPVTFAVSSVDVNHGFGIYDESLRLVAQVQAMPGYVNTLRHTFTEPGIYRVLCLEYCGVSHHDMPAEFVITAP